jgi:hypothetical protein
MAALGAPAVHDVELGAHQAAAAVLGAGADELRLADADRHAAVRPRLRHQVQARRDGAGARVDDDGGVAGTERWVTALVEVARPRRQVAVRLVTVLHAQDVAHERGQRVGVGRGGRPEDEAVAEVTDHGARG